MLRNGNGQDTIILHGSNGNLVAGGNGQDGDIVLRNGNGQDTIILHGSNGNLVAGGNRVNGDIVLKDTEGQNRIRLTGANANLHLGGNEADGDLFIYPRAGDNSDATTATIHLNGDTGDIILQNADCAEDFDVPEGEEIEPGTVVMINGEGQLQQSTQAYDKKVAGVISGAGDCRPGIVLGRQNGRNTGLPVALTGKVYCKVDTQYSPIEVGDLLTTSPTPGYAMKAADPLRAFGAVIGKALTSFKEGTGLIPILVALQ